MKQTDEVGLSLWAEVEELEALVGYYDDEVQVREDEHEWPLIDHSKLWEEI